jgi:hypothetical protein
MAQQPKKSKQDSDRTLELGKKLQAFYDMGYVSRKQALQFSFLKGLAGGAGAFIGGTLVITLVLWLLSLFSNVPLVDNFVRSVQESLHKR